MITGVPPGVAHEPLSLRFMINTDLCLRLDIILPFFLLFEQIKMIEVFLFGIVLGLIPITLAGLLFTALNSFATAAYAALNSLHPS
ncbi:cytochrome b6-f complex subunit PetG, partial [Mycobacterium tuberculosis]|uniref:cytochrome b6-f complex subunit PetG n=1 Tax=Mycobacterium tuberculosis TaxID=1773 RepID=UPI001AE5DA17|nr:hypothetical protein [Mycobacterium tuberculosis]